MKLDIGCGLNPHLPDDPEWEHLNFHPGPHIEYVCDWEFIPLDSESVDEIWLGDTIEHIPLWKHKDVLPEWNRIMKLGGIIAGQTPNAEWILQATTLPEGHPGKMTIKWAVVPNLYGWTDRPTEQHYITYYRTLLTESLAPYGFDVRDYSGSPGPPNNPWWLVFKGRKVRNL